MFLIRVVLQLTSKRERGMCKWVSSSTYGMPEPSRAGHKALLVQIAVAEVMGIHLTEMCGQERGGARAAFARQMAMYLCHLVFAMRVSEIAVSFGRDRTTVAHALRRIEEARENPDVDRYLCWLEAVLCRAGSSYA